MRCATLQRNTAETKISLSLNVDGTGKTEIATGCGFLDHMLTLFAAHGRLDAGEEAKLHRLLYKIIGIEE